MVAVSEVLAAAQALKTVVELVKDLLGAGRAQPTDPKVRQLEAAIIEAESRALAAYPAVAALEERVRDLTEENARMKAWERERDRYQLHELVPGAFVYRVKEEARGAEPVHAVCATCFQQGLKSILQEKDAPGRRRVAACPKCSFEIVVQSPPAPTQRLAIEE
jgi:DNA-directed RNA polymerase subunit RPC12/RpoP